MPISNQTSSRRKQPKNLSDGFLEAFRDIGSGVAKDFKQSLFDSARSKSDINLDSEQLLNVKENNLEKQYRQQWLRSESLRHQEQLLFSREKRENQEHIEQLKNEIQGLAKSTGDLARQVDISAAQIADNTPASAYHLNFFEHLRKLIAKLRSQINESALWLESWNKKATKKNTYWRGVKKSGSKYLLSQDRYMATQAG